MLGGNPLLDSPIDLSQRGRYNVELVANVAHYRMPRATMLITITRIMAPWSIDVGGQRSTRSATWRFLEGLAVAAKLSGARTHKIVNR